MNDSAPVNPLFAFFTNLEDPRSPLGRLHSLETIVTLVLVAMVCGADEWVEIEEFGKANLDLFERHFGVAHNGIPSHDTLGRVFALIDPIAFQRAFRDYTATLAQRVESIQIDGKTMRGSHDTYSGRTARHVVSAWADDSRLVLAQVATAQKSNEITAIPELLGLLYLSGCVVTIDAMGTQRAIAQQIVEAKADYILAVKDNQPDLNEEVTECFEKVGTTSDETTIQTVHADHGCLETRTYQVCPVVDYLTPQLIAAWPQLRTMVRVDSRVEFINGRRQGQFTTEQRYFISSLEPSQAQRITTSIRQHWGIENRLHYVLDVAFREDHNRTRKGHAAVNQAVVRHFAVNQLRRETTARVGIKAKRKKAGWDRKYLWKVLRA